jgi:hypothetical protein
MVDPLFLGRVLLRFLLCRVLYLVRLLLYLVCLDGKLGSSIIFVNSTIGVLMVLVLVMERSLQMTMKLNRMMMKELWMWMERI